jgi:hypothetical protein
MLSYRAYLILCPRDIKEANATLFFSNETSLANVIGGMKHRCCSSEDANVSKINFMYFNPEGRGTLFGSRSPIPSEFERLAYRRKFSNEEEQEAILIKRERRSRSGHPGVVWR